MHKTHTYDIQCLCDEAIETYCAKYDCIGKGRNRVVVEVDDDTVAKIPIDSYGVDDNYHENRIYEKYGSTSGPDGQKYAKCWLETYKDIPILMMEKVEPYFGSTKGLPNWCWCVDCWQVGHNAKGELVAYDYGRN